MPRIIALTGATGFIGGALARRLRIEHRQVRALARPTSNRKHLAGMGIHWIEGGLDDLEVLRRLVDGVYAVVHCAGIVRSPTFSRFIHVNSHGVARLVKAASEQHPAPRFLLVSSLAAREPCISPYAASKRQGEEALAVGAGHMSWAAFRPSPVYGPGDKEMFPLFRWMYRGIAPVPAPASARFSMLYIKDLVDAIIQWLDSDSTQKRTFELHDGQPDGYGWEDLIHIIARLRRGHVYSVPVSPCILDWLAGLNALRARLTGYAPMLTRGKVRELRHSNWVCDNSDLIRETGWMPHISLEEGLRHTLRIELKRRLK